MEVTVYASLYRVVEKSSGKVLAIWPAHSFEAPEPDPGSHPASMFRRERADAEPLRVKVPFGSVLTPSSSTRLAEPILMLKTHDCEGWHAADVARFAWAGEKGFSLLSEPFSQPAHAADPNTG